MTDFVTAEVRSKWMSGIGGKNTQPELAVRRQLCDDGFRYRLHVRSVPGTPDIVLHKFGVCIFVNGCFWHCHRGCAYARVPGTHRSQWELKFARTLVRDAAVRSTLRAMHWRVIDIWECGIKDVLAPDLTWLGEEIRSGSRKRIQWPAGPRKRRSIERPHGVDKR